MKPAKPRGRPHLDPNDTSVSVHFRLPSKQYDATVQRATRERETLADFIRRRLAAADHEPTD